MNAVNGIRDLGKLPVGTRVTINAAPAGWSIVSPEMLEFTITCDRDLDIEVVLVASTATAVDAPAITYGQNGVITVTVSSAAGRGTWRSEHFEIGRAHV